MQTLRFKIRTIEIAESDQAALDDVGQIVHRLVRYRRADPEDLERAGRLLIELAERHSPVRRAA